MKKIPLFILLISLFISCKTSESIKQSTFKLSTSNGLIVSAFDAKENRIDYVYPHIFARLDSVRQVRPYVGNIKLKGSAKPNKTSYVDNTHVITSEYKDFTIYYTASFQNHDKVFYIVVRGEKDKIESISFDAETTPNTPVSGIDHLENPYEDLPCLIAGNTIQGTYTKQYEGNIYEKYFLYSFTDSLHTDKSIVDKTIERLKTSKSSLVDDEVKYMRNIINKCNIPTTASAKEKSVIEQSITILKMAQVSEHEVIPSARGQIMAAIRPGLWHMAWVRDGSFAITAMTRLGMHDEARKGLEFMLMAPTNKMKHYIHTDGKDYGPGMDYQIALMAYYGNGTEDFCATDKGPNIEYDNFGIFLTTFMDYVNRTDDWEFYNKWNNVVTTRVANVIINCMNKENRLIKADSGPWEHWLAQPKQYIYTSGVCARGLELLSEAQKSKNLPYEQYEKASSEIKKAIIDNMLVNNKYFKGNAQDSDPKADYEYWDGGSFEVFANGLVDDKTLFDSHIEAYNKVLTIPGDRLAYIRLQSSDPYENQEWVFINLRIAYAHLLFGNKDVAYKLIDYMTEQASHNNNLIPEMISNKTHMSKVNPDFYTTEVWCNCVRDEDQVCIGIIPMVGYGAGAYSIALLTYYGY